MTLRRNDLNVSLEEERWMFHFLHSSAITAWATVEIMLARLVVYGVPATHANSLFPAFAGLESFRAKLDFADRYVRSSTTEKPELVANWESVYDTLAKCSQDRNQLAHWGIVEYAPGEIGARFALLPISIKPGSKIEVQSKKRRDVFDAPDYAIHLRRLEEIRLGVDHAVTCAARFAATLHGAADPMPNYPGRKTSPTLTVLIEQLRAARHSGTETEA